MLGLFPGFIEKPLIYPKYFWDDSANLPEAVTGLGPGYFPVLWDKLNSRMYTYAAGPFISGSTANQINRVNNNSGLAVRTWPLLGSVPDTADPTRNVFLRNRLLLRDDPSHSRTTRYTVFTLSTPSGHPSFKTSQIATSVALGKLTAITLFCAHRNFLEVQQRANPDRQTYEFKVSTRPQDSLTDDDFFRPDATPVASALLGVIEYVAYSYDAGGNQSSASSFRNVSISLASIFAYPVFLPIVTTRVYETGSNGVQGAGNQYTNPFSANQEFTLYKGESLTNAGTGKIDLELLSSSPQDSFTAYSKELAIPVAISPLTGHLWCYNGLEAFKSISCIDIQTQQRLFSFGGCFRRNDSLGYTQTAVNRLLEPDCIAFAANSGGTEFVVVAGFENSGNNSIAVLDTTSQTFQGFTSTEPYRPFPNNRNQALVAASPEAGSGNAIAYLITKLDNDVQIIKLNLSTRVATVHSTILQADLTGITNELNTFAALYSATDNSLILIILNKIIKYSLTTNSIVWQTNTRLIDRVPYRADDISNNIWYYYASESQTGQNLGSPTKVDLITGEVEVQYQHNLSNTDLRPRTSVYDGSTNFLWGSYTDLYAVSTNMTPLPR